MPEDLLQRVLAFMNRETGWAGEWSAGLAAASEPPLDPLAPGTPLLVAQTDADEARRVHGFLVRQGVRCHPKSLDAGRFLFVVKTPRNRNGPS